MKGVGRRSPRLLAQRALRVTSAAWGSWVTSGSAPKRKEICLPEAVVWAGCLHDASEELNRSEPCLMMTQARLGLEQDPVFSTLSRVEGRTAAWQCHVLCPPLLSVSRRTPAEGQREVLKEEKKKKVWAENEESDGNPLRTTMAAAFADGSTIRRAPWCSLDQTDRCQRAESRCCRQQHLRNTGTQLGRKQGGTPAVIYFQEAYWHLCFPETTNSKLIFTFK